MPLESRLGEFAAELEKAMRAVELAGAEKVVEAAKERVPVDPAEKTHLRDAIHAQETEDGVMVVAGDKKHWWGHIIEHGSVKQPAHPFLVPSLEEHRAGIVADAEAALRRLT